MRKKGGIDFEAEVVVDVNKKDMKRLTGLAARQLALEDEILEAKDRVTSLEESHRELSMLKLPMLMTELGVSSFTLTTGESVAVRESIKASIPAKNWGAAREWLCDNGHEALIKNQVTVAFGRGERALADEFVARTEREGLSPVRKEGVHPQTLGAFVREQLEEGADIPMDLLGVFQLRQTTIKSSK